VKKQKNVYSIILSYNGFLFKSLTKKYKNYAAKRENLTNRDFCGIIGTSLKIKEVVMKKIIFLFAF